MLRVYKSSAGSGKTYTLVREFLRIALKQPDKFKHILAITFTNKAANEMKERIIDALSEIQHNDAKRKSLIDELAEETELSEEEVVEKAGLMLRSILHNYADLSVSTIDSFVHRVIRSFTYDLHLPMSFNVEVDSDKLLTETIEMLMDRLTAEDDQLSAAVVEFAESNIEEGKSWNLEHNLAQLGKELFNEDAYHFLGKLEQLDLSEMKKVRGSLYQFVNAFEERLYSEGKKAMLLIQQAGLNSSAFYQTTKGIYGFFQKYAAGEFPTNTKGNSYVLASVNENKWAAGKTTDIDKSRIESIKGQLVIHYQNILSIWDKQSEDYHLAKLLLGNFYSFILLADMQKLMHDYKKENNILHISEFQEKINAIVKEQDAPVIYERIGDWYDSILIDEHQDTSVLQWQNLVPLVENAQFKSEDSLVVGDGKQAIYRFRNGKVEQFAVLPKIYNSEKDIRLKEREVAITNYGTESKNLEYNYRSRKEIVDFNNRFYEVISALPELANKTIYEDQSQKYGRDAAGGYVRIEFLAKNEETDLGEQRCQRVEILVNEILAKGYQLKDITVLTRSNVNGSLIAAHLINKGIQVISSESLLINNSPRVNLLLSTLRYFDQKDNHISRAEMVYYIHLLCLNKEFRFEQFDFKTTEEEFEQHVSQLLNKEFKSYNFLSYQIVELLQQLIHFYKQAGDDPFLQFFLDEAMTFSKNNRSNIREFLDWWEEVKYKKSIIYPETLNAVRIMTIHKSKGLQFPVVILADADWPQKNTKNYFWVDIDKPWLKNLNVGVLPVTKQVQETEYAFLYNEEEASSFLDMLNLLYVATTRPEDMLYILSTEMKNVPVAKNSVTALLVEFLNAEAVWDGFHGYEFGDSNTTALAGKKATLKKLYEKGEMPEADESIRPINIKTNARLLWNKEKVEKIEEGSLIHKILQRINYAEDVDRVLQKVINEGLISENELVEIKNMVNGIIQLPEIAPFFSLPYKAITERPLLSKNGMRVPDRVVVNNDEVIVLEYKTGEEHGVFSRQVKDYLTAIKPFGFKHSHGFIVYVNEKRVVRV